VPVGTIRSRVSRARADLVAALGEGDLDVAAD
jgi:DNA-directed RNA polymerase specialized sigma24 family protein